MILFSPLYIVFAVFLLTFVAPFLDYYQMYAYDGTAPLWYTYGFGGAMAIFAAASVTILKSKFINNYSAGDTIRLLLSRDELFFS